MIRGALALLGYERATWAGVPGHEVFGKGDPGTHLIHVVPLHGPAWDRMIGFPDALRRDASLAAEYGELKRPSGAVPQGPAGLYRWQNQHCRARARSEVMSAFDPLRTLLDPVGYAHEGSGR
jgi:GrpB-like predicted nucleotidyltransferase (UPF0157 family)